MGKKNPSSSVLLAAAILTAADAAKITRRERLETARTKYIKSNTSLVAKVGRELGGTAKVYGTLADLAKAIRPIDPIKAIAKAEKICAEMKSTKEADPKTGKLAGVMTPATIKQLAAFKDSLGDEYIAANNGNVFEVIATALDTFVEFSAFTYAETFTDKSGGVHTRPIDVRDDANSMYGFKVGRNVRLAGSAVFGK